MYNNIMTTSKADDKIDNICLSIRLQSITLIMAHRAIPMFAFPRV